MSNSIQKIRTFLHLQDGIILFKSMTYVIEVPCTRFGVLMFVETLLLLEAMVIQWSQAATEWKTVLKCGISECLRGLKSLIGLALAVMSWLLNKKRRVNWKICQNLKQKEKSQNSL